MVSALLNFFLDFGTFFTESEPATVTCSHEVSDIQPWASASGGAAFLGALLRGALALTGAPEADKKQWKAGERQLKTGKRQLKASHDCRGCSGAEQQVVG